MSSDRCVSRRGVVAAAPFVAAGLSGTLAGQAYGEERPLAADAQLLNSADVVDFLYIDSSELGTGQAQNIVVSLRDYAGFSSATLTLRNADTGAQATAPMGKAADGAILFSYTPENAGVYEVASVGFVASGASYMVDFSDADSSYRSFSVTAADVPAAGASTENEEPELQVYTADGDDELVQSDSIEEGASAAMALTAAPMALSDTKEGPLVIALDPGHVGASSGAVANNTTEASATWKIAQYCKAELETYEGVTVVLTVTEGEHLTYSDNELAERVRRAVSKGADVLVSLHLNSTGNGSGHGAEVWAPHDVGYNHTTHEVGVDLGNKILAQLESLGLKNRGVKFRVIDQDNSYNYPDGSYADYYGIIRNARKANLPAIIVEHAFLDNWNDFNNYLSSDAKLQSLGVADAAGIANYYGLSHGVGTVYRLYYAPTLDHHYTMDAWEYRVLGQRGWKQEGIAWKSPETSSVPVYRLYHEGTKDHHYTTDVWEYKVLGQRGWKQEGIAWYSDDAKTVPVYRLYHEGTKDHHYTKDAWEYKVLGQRGWKQEGVAWYSLE